VSVSNIANVYFAIAGNDVAVDATLVSLLYYVGLLY